MALTYDLDLETDAGAEYVRALILSTGAFTRQNNFLFSDGVQVSFLQFDLSDPGHVRMRQIASEDFDLTPDLSIGFRIDTLEHTEVGERTAILLAARLSRELSQRARATKMSDFVVFERHDGALTVDASWAPYHEDALALVDEPYTLADLRGAEAARQKDAEGE